MKELLLDRDATSGITYLIPFADATDTYKIALAADTPASVSVPSDARKCVFNLESGLSYYVSDAAIAAVPNGATFTNGQRMKVNPPGLSQLDFLGITNLHFIAASAAVLVVEFYR